MAKLIGNAPNQVPTNADLGSMAFEDKKNYPTVSSSIYQPFRNIIINGDMSIAQRGTSATGLTGTGYHSLDRFNINAYNIASAVYTMEQSTDAPTGFYNSLKLTPTTANGTQDANEQFNIEQYIEAQNIYNLDFYTATADSVTISFYIKTNNTGTYPINLKLSDNNSTASNSSTRLYRTTYTVNSADTWEKKTVTLQLDTSTSETRPTGNNFGMAVQFWLGAGSSRDGGTANSWGNNGNNCTASDNLNFLGSTSNEVYLTGVQIEKGTTVSDFEFLPYDVNLRRCQRYYQTLGFGNIAMAEAGSTYVMNLPHIQTMRSVPSKGLNISSNLRVRQFGISDRDASSPSVTSSTGSNAGSYIKVSGFASIGSASTPAGIGYTTSSENGDAFKLDAEL